MLVKLNGSIFLHGRNYLNNSDCDFDIIVCSKEQHDIQDSKNHVEVKFRSRSTGREKVMKNKQMDIRTSFIHKALPRRNEESTSSSTSCVNDHINFHRANDRILGINQTKVETNSYANSHPYGQRSTDNVRTQVQVKPQNMGYSNTVSDFSPNDGANSLPGVLKLIFD